MTETEEAAIKEICGIHNRAVDESLRSVLCACKTASEEKNKQQAETIEELRADRDNLVASLKMCSANETRLLDENRKMRACLRMAHGISDFEKTWKHKEENKKLRKEICEIRSEVSTEWRATIDKVAELEDENRKMKAILSAKRPYCRYPGYVALPPGAGTYEVVSE